MLDYFRLVVPLIHRLVPYFLLIHRLSYTGFIHLAPDQIRFYVNHRRTGLEILGGGRKHESARLALKARKPLEGSGGMVPRKILKNRVSLMPFPLFWSEF